MQSAPQPEAVLTAYQGIRSRTISLVRSLDASQALTPVPACPGWTVGNLLSHLYGVVDDILSGRLEGAGSDAWTNAQVIRHEGKSLDELCDAWENSAEGFDPVLLRIPSPVNLRIVMDQASHEHDLRHGVGQPGAQASDAVALGTIWLMDSLRAEDPALAACIAGVSVPPFEFFRAVSGRRSQRQLEALGFPAEQFAARLVGSPISVPEADLIESVAN